MNGVPPVQEAAAALEAFDLPSSPEITRFTGGQGNASYLVRAEPDTYVLTFSIEKTLEEFHSLATVLRVLEHHAFPTSRVVPLRDGSPVGVAGGRPFMLKRYIPGSCLTRVTPSLTQQLGRIVATLHGVPPPTGVPRGHPYGRAQFREIIEGEESSPFRSWLERQSLTLGRRLPPEGEVGSGSGLGFIHGDLFPDNLLVGGVHVSAIIDFEEACVDWPMLDIGMALVGLSTENPNGTAWVDAFLDGYRSVRPLARIEQLPLFVEYAATATAFWRYRHYHVRRRRLTAKTDYRAMVAVADRVRTQGLAGLSSAESGTSG